MTQSALTETNIAQDLQYHEVKYIIDKTYEQRNLTRDKVQQYRKVKDSISQSEQIELKQQIKKSYRLYKQYQTRMQDMMVSYLNSIRNSRHHFLAYKNSHVAAQRVSA